LNALYTGKFEVSWHLFLNHYKKKKHTLMLSLRADGKRAALMKKCAQIQHMRLDKMCSKNKGY